MALRIVLAERDDFRRERDMARGESAKYLRERDIAMTNATNHGGANSVGTEADQCDLNWPAPE